MVQAVTPAPDGGYPGANTAEGQNTLLSLTTGTYNTAVGWFSLRSNTSGILNTSVGAGALLANTGDENTALGAGALLSNTVGVLNTANGAFALFSNTTGFQNTATGAFALFSNTASNNTATGFRALSKNTTGIRNTASGGQALFNNTIGGGNTATGYDALVNNTEGNVSTATGMQALFSNTTGGGNTATGFGALFSNTEGSNNLANGYSALASNTTGVGNTAIGNQALGNNTSGSYNIAINGGHNLTTGIFNIVIANDGVAGESNTTRIGILQNRCFISGIREVTTGVPDAINVMIDSAGQLGTVSSSRRFKDQIKPMGQASAAILGLKPVTFHYKSDPAGAGPQFGLIAEEVAEVNPDLVVREKDGEIYTVRYDAVNAMLLNEFLKEHRTVQKQACKIQEQETTIAELKREMESVVAHAKEQDANIQRVNAQIELSRPAPRQAGVTIP